MSDIIAIYNGNSTLYMLEMEGWWTMGRLWSVSEHRTVKSAAESEMKRVRCVGWCYVRTCNGPREMAEEDLRGELRGEEEEGHANAAMPRWVRETHAFGVRHKGRPSRLDQPRRSPAFHGHSRIPPASGMSIIHC